MEAFTCKNCGSHFPPLWQIVDQGPAVADYHFANLRKTQGSGRKPTPSGPFTNVKMSRAAQSGDGAGAGAAQESGMSVSSSSFSLHSTSSI